MSTIFKLAAIADYADTNEHYILANDATQLIKTSQLWDALRTLFDPEHTPGIDRSTPFWKRLSKGWSRGRMDRNLGLVLAIMTERTKLNKKIDNLTAPIKAFQEQVSGFYEKLRNGGITSVNIREESRELQTHLKETLKLISGKELRQILKLREKLEEQQLKAAERIKGLDDETKNNLMAVLKGENLPGAEPKASGLPGEASTGDRMAKWMRGLGVAKSRSLHEGRQSKNLNMFRPFVTEYQANPAMVLEFFNGNPRALEQGFDMFGKEFANMYYWAENAVQKDKEAAEKEKVVPGAGQTVEPAASPAKETPVMPVTSVAPVAATPSIAKEQKKLERAEEVATVQKVLEQIEKEEAPKSKSKAKSKAAPPILPVMPPPAVVPEKKSPADDIILATSASKRLEREITRLSRIQQLRKISEVEILENQARDLRFDEEEHSPEPEMDMEELLDLKRKVDQLPLDDPQFQAWPSDDEKDLTSNIHHVLNEPHGSERIYDLRQEEVDKLYKELSNIRTKFKYEHPEEMYEEDFKKIPEYHKMKKLYERLHNILTEEMGYSDRMAYQRLANNRMNKIKKLAVDWDEYAKSLDPYDKAIDILYGDPKDIQNDPDVFEALPEGRETFDEEKHPNPEEVEYYKGRKSDEDYYDDKDDIDIQNLKYKREYPEIPYSELTPEDDDWNPSRPKPKLTPTKEEELQGLAAQLRSVRRNLDNFRTSRDNEIGDYYRKHDLETKKKMLINKIKQLSGLPEGWVSD